ncbi:MAG: Crp/Fnr family transcriptional regulator [Hyphomicrobiales bacterium]
MSATGLELLRRLEFFSAFSEEALRLISFAAEDRDIAPGEALFREGDAAAGGIIVVSGLLQLSDRNDTGTTLTAGPGDLIGELALLFPTTRAMTAIARTECTLLTISRTIVKRALGEFPDTAARLHRMLSGRLTELNAGLTAVSGMLEKIDTPS